MLRRLVREYAVIFAVLVYGFLLACIAVVRSAVGVLPWSPVQIAAGLLFAFCVGASAGLVAVAS
jgi:hypothetical protein